jgi:hypothetical protein
MLGVCLRKNCLLCILPITKDLGWSCHSYRRSVLCFSKSRCTTYECLNLATWCRRAAVATGGKRASTTNMATNRMVLAQEVGVMLRMVEVMNRGDKIGLTLMAIAVI